MNYHAMASSAGTTNRSGAGRRHAGVLAAFVLCLFGFAGSGAPAAGAAECPNEAIRVQQGVAQGSAFLPYCMALEQVSPPQKNGSPAFEPWISADGNRAVFKSAAALGGTAGLNSAVGDLYVATRDPGGAGWVTAPTSAPAEYGFGFSFGNDTPAAFSTDFKSWFSFAGNQTQTIEGRTTLFESRLDDFTGSGRSFLARTPLLLPLSGDRSSGVALGATFDGNSADLSHLYFQPGLPVSNNLETSYLPGDPRPTQVKSPRVWEHLNVYVASGTASGEPHLELLGRDGSGTVWGGNCSTWVGGGGLVYGVVGPGGRNQGAVSPDGSFVYLSTIPTQAPINPAKPSEPACDITKPIRILTREETSGGPQIAELIPGGPAAGSDYFEGASIDQSKVYFTSDRALVPGDHDPGTGACSADADLDTSAGCDLYLYDSTLPPGERIVLVSGGDGTAPSPGLGADVYRNIAAISGDGSHVYYVAQSVLTTAPNPEGAVAQDGDLNLYSYRRDAAHPDGETAFVGKLDPTCISFGSPGYSAQDDCQVLAGWRFSYFNSVSAVPIKGQDLAGTEVGGDGHVFVFLSAAELTADDADGSRRDVYRYDADAQTLRCVSCRPGGPDAGAFAVGGRQNPKLFPGPEFAEKERWVSEDGNSVVFATAQPLLETDVDGKETPYLWRDDGAGGELTQLPGFRRNESVPTIKPTISPDGESAVFTSSAALLPTDIDTTEDVYVARVDGGFAAATSPSPCQGEACQGPPSPAIAQTAPGSSSLSGLGNVQHQRKARKHKKARKHRKKHRKQRHAKRAARNQGGAR